MRRSLGFGAVGFMAALSACLGNATSGFGGGTFGDASAAVEGGSSASAADADGGHGGSDAGRLLVADATQPGPASGPAIVYGQSATTLYAVNPNTNDVTTVADFQGCSARSSTSRSIRTRTCTRPPTKASTRSTA